MGRARHRLTALRQAVVNTPEIVKPGNEYEVEARMDNDTYTHHVGGLYAGAGETGGRDGLETFIRDYYVGFLGGATGHTGTTSDCYKMSHHIQAVGFGPDGNTNWTRPYQNEFLEIGAWLPNDFCTLDTANIPAWKYEFNETQYSSRPTGVGQGPGAAGLTFDGSLGGRAQRAYLFIDLNLAANRGQDGGKLAPIPQPGDEVEYAQLCLKLNAIMFHDSQTFLDHRFRFGSTDQYSILPNNVIAGACFDAGGTYCAYKVVRGFTNSDSLANLNWLGWSGGLNSDRDQGDFWVEAGGNKYSANGSTGDITDLGTSSCYIFQDGDYVGFVPRQAGLPPIVSDFSTTISGRGPIVLGSEDIDDVDTGDDPVQEGPTDPGGGTGGNPEIGTEVWMCFEIGHLLQDAIDNESNLLRVAIYRDDDGGDVALVQPANEYTRDGVTYELGQVYDQSMDNASDDDQQTGPSNNSRAIWHEQFRHAVRVHSCDSPDQSARPRLTYKFRDNT